MPQMISLEKSDRKCVYNLDDVLELVDEWMGRDTAAWLRDYIDALEAEHTEDLDRLKDECDDKIAAVRAERDARLAEMEEYYSARK